MILAKNVTKVYTNGKGSVLALNSVNFSLPDTGFVFVIGKSGSGKSTLINMLGGLDSITSGEIFVDGIDICKLDQVKLDEYHNNYVGIIYQNYNLFEEETVLENVLIANRIAKDKRSSQEIDELLDKLEISQKKNTKVQNLSGGQKQRVAIARALVKHPKVLLADEPTGNLDSRTTKSIFNLLKKVSKERLVVVISHDMKSALNYADRILRISDGAIVEDLTKNTGDTTKEWNYLELEDSQEISDEKIKELNKAIKSTKYRVIRKGHHFIPTSQLEKKEEVVENKHEKPKPVFKRSILTGLKATKRNIFTIVATSLINMLVIGLLSLSSCFVHFQGKTAIRDVAETYEIKNIVVRKSYSEVGNYLKLKEKNLVEIYDEDEELFDSFGYSGKRYPIYNIDLLYNSQGNYSTSSLNSDRIDYENFYPLSGYGVTVCDTEYLEQLFGKNLQILAGSLYETSTSWQVVVPDYVADSIIFYNPSLKSNDENDPYQKVLSDRMFYRYRIGAVIKTNYKEKYETFLEVLDRMIREPQNASEIRKAIIQSEMYVDYLSDVQSRLNFAYSINPNFIKEYRKNIAHSYIGNSTYMINNSGNEENIYRGYYSRYNKELTGNDAEIDMKMYNTLFKKNITYVEDPTFEPFDITFRNYGLEDLYFENPKHEVTLHVKALTNMTSGHFNVAKEVFEEMKTWNMFQYAWAYSEVTECYQIYEDMTPYCFFNPIECFAAVYNTINIVGIFAQVFGVLLYVLLGILAVVLVMHNFRVIKKEQYRFGVYKSLGYSNLYLTIVIFVTNMIMFLAIFALSTAFSFGGSFLANSLLQMGFARYHSNKIFYKITLLTFNFKYTLYYNLATLGIMLVSSFIPLLIIRKIKPSQIIRNAE